MINPKIHVIEKDDYWIVTNNWSNSVMRKYSSKMLAIGYAVKYSKRTYINPKVIVHGDMWCKI